MAAPKGNKNAVGNNGGAPDKYDSRFPAMAKKLCLLGYNDEELAGFFNVHVSTIGNWKNDYIEFFEALNEGKAIADADVAQAFYKRACGYRYDEVTYEKQITALDGESDEDDIKMEVYKKKVVTKELPPDAGAALNWLKNRQKGKWRDKIEQGFTDNEGNDVNPVTVFQLPDNGRSKTD